MARDTDSRSSDTANPTATFLIRRWPALLIIAVAGVFVVQNHNEVGIHVLSASVHAPMWLVLIIIFAAGVLAGAISTRRHHD